MKQDHELAGIEFLRFMCALSVLLWHYQGFFFVDQDMSPANRQMQPMYGFFFAAYNYGYWAVQGFWVISGFIFYRQYAEPVQQRSITLKEFAVRRFSRLYPLHFVTLLLVAMGQYSYISSHGTAFGFPDNSLHSFVYQLFFASNWFQWQQYSFNGPIWSVSAEILIYVTFFCVAKTLGSNALVALLAAGISWSLMRFADGFLNQNVFACGMFFFAGGVAERIGKGRWALPLAACTSIATVAFLALGLLDINNKSALALSISGVVLFARLSATPARRILAHLGFLGNATYSSYVLHFPLQLATVVIIDAAGLTRSLFLNPTALLAYLATVIGCSLAVYRWFERPAQDWIRGLSLGFYRG